jgi:hypothetical protein
LDLFLARWRGSDADFGSSSLFLDLFLARWRKSDAVFGSLSRELVNGGFDCAGSDAWCLFWIFLSCGGGGRVLILDLYLSIWIFFSCGGGNRMLILDLYLVSWLTAVLIALVRMVTSGKCDFNFNPGAADFDQLHDLGCTFFLSDGAAAVVPLDAAVGAVVFSDVAAPFFGGSCAVAVVLSDAAAPF